MSAEQENRIGELVETVFCMEKNDRALRMNIVGLQDTVAELKLELELAKAEASVSNHALYEAENGESWGEDTWGDESKARLKRAREAIDKAKADQ